MNKKPDDQFLVMQSMIDANIQDYYDKMNKQDSKIENLTAMFKNMMYQIQI